MDTLGRNHVTHETMKTMMNLSLSPQMPWQALAWLTPIFAVFFAHSTSHTGLNFRSPLWVVSSCQGLTHHCLLITSNVFCRFHEEFPKDCGAVRSAADSTCFLFSYSSLTFTKGGIYKCPTLFAKRIKWPSCPRHSGSNPTGVSWHSLK